MYQDTTLVNMLQSKGVQAEGTGMANMYDMQYREGCKLTFRATIGEGGSFTNAEVTELTLVGSGKGIVVYDSNNLIVNDGKLYSLNGSVKSLEEKYPNYLMGLPSVKDDPNHFRGFEVTLELDANV